MNRVRINGELGGNALGICTPKRFLSLIAVKFTSHILNIGKLYVVRPKHICVFRYMHDLANNRIRGS